MGTIKEELEHILHRVSSSIGIKHYNLILDLNPSIGDGFVGQLYTGQVKNVDTDEIIDVAIKKIPYKRNDLGVMFRNEHICYSDIYPALNRFQIEHGVPRPFTNVPKYFCGCSDSEYAYIALENLKPTGFVLHDKTSYLDRIHLEYVFRVYGRFHALSFVFEKQNPERCKELLKEINVIFETYSIKDIANPIRDAFSGAVNALDKRNEAELFETCRKFIEDIGGDFLRATKYEQEYSCINHGDCWSNNMLFKYDPSGNIEDLQLIDFQLCRKTTPIHDLSYFLYSGGSAEDFHKLPIYLKIYYDSFSEITSDLGYDVEDIYPYMNLLAEWKENAFFGILMAIYLWQYKLYPKDKVSAILGNYQLTADEKRSKWDELKKEVHQSCSFKEKTRPLLKHMIDENLLFHSRNR